jgi:aspartyl-tRNA(Asn)/glutamyl-tRNA(Gln) amidotransferase subunit C
MEVTPELIEHLAKLSKLNPSEAQKISLKQDLEKMIAMVDKLQEVDVADTPALMHMHNLASSYRADEPSEHLSNQSAMDISQNAATPYYAVPKVIEQA